jgi:hypothetical protein
VSGERRTKNGVRSGGLLRFCLPVIFSFVSVLCLSGCLDAAVEMGGPQAKVVGARSAGPLISPHGASLAIVSVEGPPDEVGARFRNELESAAQSRDVALAEAERANYRLRAFLTASPAEGATRVAYVLDIYDRRGRRVQRLASEAGVEADPDPWRAVDEKSLILCAEKGADDLAAFLATTPEAIAAAGGEAGVTVVAAEREKSAPMPRSVAAAAGDKH